MNIYILAYDDTFLDAQMQSISRHMPQASVRIVASRNATPRLISRSAQFVRVDGDTTFTMLRWLLPQVDDAPSAFLEWDMVLTAPIAARNAINKEPGVDFEQYHPSFLSFLSVRDLNPSFLISQLSRPFKSDFAIVHQRWMNSGCGLKHYFRRLDNGILHFHHKAAFKTREIMTPERIACWDELMRAEGLKPASSARMGLGDMVAAGLSAVGVTKERVSAAIGRPCSCPERQAALNRIGHKYLGLPTGIRG